MAVLKRESNQARTNLEGTVTILGPESEFQGKLSFDGTVRIEGRFKGEIQSKDVLIVHDAAKVEGTIRVGRIVISGQVTGDVYAKESVEINKPGVLRGNVYTPELIIERGVIFQGSSHMENLDKLSKPNQNRSKSEKALSVVTPPNHHNPHS